MQTAAQQIPLWSLVLAAVNTFSLVADPFCEEWEGQRIIALKGRESERLNKNDALLCFAGFLGVRVK